MSEKQNTGIYSFVTSVGRLIDVNVAETRRFEKKVAGQPSTFGAPEYSVRMTIKPEESGELWEATQAAADIMWPPQVLIENGQQVRRGGRDWLTTGMMHNPLRKGDELYAVDPKKNALFQGMLYFNSSSPESRQPLVFDATGEVMDPAKIYAGCYARCVLNVKAYKNGTNQGVKYYLQGVQFVADGPRLERTVARTAAALAAKPFTPVAPVFNGSGPNYSGSPYTPPAAIPAFPQGTFAPSVQANPQAMLAAAVAQAEQQWGAPPSVQPPMAPPAYATPIQAPPAPAYAAPMAAPPGMSAYPAPVALPPAPLPGAQPGYPPGFFPGR